jgi:hypothetical protein
MEPDSEKIIREKINRLEEQPAHWQKEFVWQQITNKANPQSRIVYWRYAAVLLIAVIVGYAVLINLQSSWKETASRIAFLEKQIDLTERMALQKTEAMPEEECPKPIMAKQPGRVRDKSNAIVKEHEPLALADKEALVGFDKDSVSQSTTIEPIVLAETKPTRTIQPIIGKIPKSNQAIVAKKVRRIRINKDEGFDFLSSEKGRQGIVARIN